MDKTKPRAKFSLGLEALSNDVLTMMNRQPTTVDEGGFTTVDEREMNGIVEDIVSSIYQEDEPEGIVKESFEVSLPTNISTKGIFVDDKESQLCILKFNHFSAFPVEYGDGSYTMCLDANPKDLTHQGILASGHKSMPESYDSIDAISEKLFKVGCAVNHEQGDEYLREFYPDIEWNTGDFAKLANGFFITAEIIVPISATSGKTILCKIVDSSPNSMIYLMGAYCSLNVFKDIFKVEGLIDNSPSKWKETDAKFIFADESYDHITGEISNYGPEEVKAKKNKETEPSSLFKNFNVSCPASDLFFVRFFVDPSLADKAEEVVGHKLPDPFCEQKNIGGASAPEAVIIGTGTIDMEYQISGNLLELEKEILSKPIKFTDAVYPYKTLSQEEIKAGGTEWGGKRTGIEQLAKAKVPRGYPMVVEAGTRAAKGVYGYTGERVPYIYIHPYAKARLENALKDVVNHYGPNMGSIVPAVCKFACSWRSKSRSVHEWGLAIDFNYHNNLPYEIGGTEASSIINKPIYQPFLDIMEHHGFRNLGRDSKRWGGNYGDWMHFQCCLTVAATNHGVIPK